MAFINTIDVLGEDAVIDSIFKKTITEFKDNTVTKVGQYAFYNCTALEAVNLPNATEVQMQAFEGCEKLVELVLPIIKSTGQNIITRTAVSKLVLPSVTTLPDNGLRNAPALRYVDLPACTKLGPYQFAEDKLMETLILRSETPCSTDANMFYLATTCPIAAGTGYIYVPKAMVNTYKAAPNWSTYANQFRAIEDYTVDGTVTGDLDIENRHMVRFFNYDGTLLEYKVVPTDGSAAYEGADPVRPNTSEMEDWEFIGWSSDPSYVTEDMDCYAQFKNNVPTARLLLTKTISGDYRNDTVEKIGVSAFYNCVSLISATFTKVTTMAESAFNGLCLSIRNCIKRAPKSTVPGQHRFGFEKPCFCSL